MDISFQGKRALVTGAGQGIGRAIAKKLSESGAIVFALSRSPEHLITLSAEAPNVKPVEVDLSNWDETKKVVEEVGPVDLLVNNAAISILEPFLEMHPESFDKMFSVNVKACINVAQVVAKGMIKEGRHGSIVNVSSKVRFDYYYFYSNLTSF